MTARTAASRAVERANQAFYDAIENSDLDGLEKVVLSGPLAESVTTVHPGWPALRGRGEVMRSYALIMANTEYIQFFLTDVEVAVDGDTALVTCTENILTGGPAEDDGSAGALVGGLVVATNVFRRTEDGWQLWAHHGSPVLADDSDDGDGSDGAQDGAADDLPDDADDAGGLTDVADLDDLAGLDTIDDLRDIAGLGDADGPGDDGKAGDEDHGGDDGDGDGDSGDSDSDDGDEDGGGPAGTGGGTED